MSVGNQTGFKRLGSLFWRTWVIGSGEKGKFCGIELDEVKIFLKNQDPPRGLSQYLILASFSILCTWNFFQSFDLQFWGFFFLVLVFVFVFGLFRVVPAACGGSRARV